MPRTAAWTVPLPPWRGYRQILAIGPWGSILDKVKKKVKKRRQEVLWIERIQNEEDSPSSFQSRIVDSALLPVCPPNHRRIVATSDTHGKHRFVHVPKCDVFIHCGDIMQRYGYMGDLGGGIPALLDFGSWVNSNKHVPAKYAVVIAGNHDKLLEKIGQKKIQSILDGIMKTKERGRRLKTGSSQNDDDNDDIDVQEKKAYYLQNEAITVCDIVLYGSPWSPVGATGNTAFQQGDSAYDAVEQALEHVVAPSSFTTGDLPTPSEGPAIDVLMTHASCGEWEKLVQKTDIQLWLHGHWHDGQGTVTEVRKKQQPLGGQSSLSSSCVSVNVASNDMIYRPCNPPIVMDVPIRTNKN